MFSYCYYYTFSLRISFHHYCFSSGFTVILFILIIILSLSSSFYLYYYISFLLLSIKITLIHNILVVLFIFTRSFHNEAWCNFIPALSFGSFKCNYLLL